jgi:hypothetical protein
MNDFSKIIESLQLSVSKHKRKLRSISDRLDLLGPFKTMDHRVNCILNEIDRLKELERS